MDEKYFWPLVGVVLGWLLTFVATGLKDRETRRRRVGLLLSKLISIRSQISVLISVTENFKDYADDWDHYERYRKGISDRHFLEPASQLESLNDAISDVSGDRPLQTLKLQGLVEMLLKSKKVSLNESSKSKELYVQLISMHEVALEVCAEELDKQVQHLALLHGLLTYLKVRYLLSNWRKRNSRSAAFLKKFADEAFAEMKKVA